MNIIEFQNIESKIEDYTYTSFKYLSFEDIKNYEVKKNTHDMIIIHGCDQMTKLDEVIYACHDFDLLVQELNNYQNSLIKHIPNEWVQKLKDLGFLEYAIFRDYWIQDITSFNDKYNQVKIAKLEDAKIISDITKENKGESRSFFGEHEDFMTSWILGTQNGLIDMKATHPRIYLYKEKNQILGVALTCIYGHDHIKGPVLWMREIAVKKAYHHQGIGKKLILTALFNAKNEGAKRSFLMADDLNRHAINLYEKIGYKPNLEEQEINMLTPKSAFMLK